MSWLCLRCRVETQPDRTLNACPACGARGVPADTLDRVTPTLTFHELRTLVIWAERWASNVDDAEHHEMRKVIYGIAHALEAQIGRSLTLLGEIQGLRKRFPGTEQNAVIEDPEQKPQ